LFGRQPWMELRIKVSASRLNKLIAIPALHRVIHGDGSLPHYCGSGAAIIAPSARRDRPPAVSS
jgi:hypothetical protein